MESTITVRLPKKLEKEISSLAKQEKTTKSKLIREAVERYVALKKFQHLRRKVLPFAEAQGLITDEDVFRAIS